MRSVLRLLGQLLSFFSLSFLLPTLVAIYYGESPLPFVLSLAIAMLAALFMLAAFGRADIESVRAKEAFAFVAIAWLLVSLFGSLPYVFSGINPVDAFFESISGFTTTGASVLIPEELPRSLLLWRSQTQWMGGMGIIVLFLAVIPSVAKAHFIFQAEYPGVTLEKLKPRIRDTALTLYKVYLLLTAIEIAMLVALGVTPFDAVCHTFTTLSTGGYSTHSESVAYFNDPRVEAVIAFFAFLGGTNFALIYFAIKRDFRILRDAEFRAYVLILAMAIITLTLINLERLEILESIRYSAFQAVSIMTTTGFTTYDFDEWSDAAKIILLVLMFVGGCSGSTAGGMKVVRIYMLVTHSLQRVLKAAEPRTVRAVRYGDRVVKRETIEDVAAFFVLYILIFVLSSVAVSLSGYDMLTSISATAATLGNVGPGMGLAGASEIYRHFDSHLKILLSINMWLGRLELFTVLAIFIPSFWREKW